MQVATAALAAFAGLLAAPGAAAGGDFPAELLDDAQVDMVIEQHGGLVPGGLGLHFNVPEAFGELESFLSLQESMEEGSSARAAIHPVDVGRVNFKDEPPILCETICRPVNETEMEAARSEAAAAEGEVRDSNAAADAFQQSPETAARMMMGGLSFMEISSKICSAKGGEWVEGVDGKEGRCEEFMRPSTATTKYNPDALFHMCKHDFGANYVPCNPYQALALATMYQIPRGHYRLWPGGRPDQVTNAAMKQQIGNNPQKGLDTCPDHQHVGFFHNWDENHVDSWGCLSDTLMLKVLCCRQPPKAAPAATVN